MKQVAIKMFKMPFMALPEFLKTQIVGAYTQVKPVILIYTVTLAVVRHTLEPG